MESHPTLESVQAEFQQWRQVKASRCTPTPDALRCKALALLEHHSVNKVRLALGITRAMLKSWHAQATPTATDMAEPIHFFSLPNEPPMPEVVTDPLILDVTQTNGNQWHLQGHLSASQLRAFVQALSGERS